MNGRLREVELFVKTEAYLRLSRLMCQGLRPSQQLGFQAMASAQLGWEVGGRSPVASEDSTALSAGLAEVVSSTGGGGVAVGMGISVESVEDSGSWAVGDAERISCTVEISSRVSVFETTFLIPTF